MDFSSQSDYFPIKEGDVLQSFYVVQEFLGEGGFGKVAKCRHRLTHQDVAIKIAKKKANIVKATKKEIANLKLLHPLDPEKANIVRWYDAFMHGDLLCLKFELLQQSLHDFMDELNFEPLPVSDLRAVVQQTANALLHLETLGIIHCDVKPQNIMVVDHVQRPLKIKLIDFGLAQHISEPPSFGGTLWYQAPEVFLGLAYSEAIDMWSLGVSMAELALGVTLYPGHHPYDMMKFMVDTQGLPPDHLLRLGPETNHYFHRSRIDGQDTWTLKTPEQVSVQYGHTFRDTREVVLNSLDDIMQMMDTETSQKEGQDFVDLLKCMMLLDGHQRIRPADVFKHPFLQESELDNAADDPPDVAEETPILTEVHVSTSEEDHEAAAILPGANREQKKLEEPPDTVFEKNFLPLLTQRL